jgi:EAL domain-containing protein (putative c-di-GMP-specific phosphodiesterase class I)
VEITEHRPVACYDDVLAALRPLREQGLHLAVDDTGAGYASFQHVLRLRPESIKLDRSLLSEITTDPARRSLVTAIVLLALDLGATVVAEGVEDEAELCALADLGVHLAQGYLLARPASDAAVQASWARLDWRPALPSAM